MKDDRWAFIRHSVRLLRPFWPIAMLATTMGAASGFGTALLLATINKILHAPGGATAALLLTFSGLCLLIVAGEIVSDLGNSFVGQQVVAAMRLDLTDRVLSAPIEEIERFRLHRLMATLNQDVETISSFTFAFSGLAIAFAITLGALIYLVVLSPLLSIAAVLAVVIGSWAHAVARSAGRSGFEAAREAQDDLQKYYRAITEGSKELRINRSRRARVRSAQIGETVLRIRNLKVRAMRIFMSANAFGSVLFFLVIGVLIALQGRMGVGNEVLSGFVIVLLYVKGPIQQLVAALPAIGQAQVSLARVVDLSIKFRNAEPGILDRSDPVTEQHIDSITLQEVVYQFPTANAHASFVLGPVDLTIGAGELLFIVGENGSGKTTLVKILLGLYEPHQGSILLNENRITSDNRDEYRQLFTTVFSDYYLFEDLVYGKALAEDVRPYLEKLEIDHKLSVENESFTTLDLSTGQRKRLALVHAYMERRPMIVFDEWAADQDPAFRRIFYTELLPELKAMGKTLIVISHDDRYFHVADRIIHMADGKIAGVELNASGGTRESGAGRSQ